MEYTIHPIAHIRTDFTDKFGKFLGLLRIHSRGRLVKQQKRRFCRKSSRNFEMSLFSVRKIGCFIICLFLQVKYF